MEVTEKAPICPDCKEEIKGIFNKRGKLIAWNWSGHKCPKRPKVNILDTRWIADVYPKGPAWTGD